MGGSTRVALKLRVQVWLETVPILLKKLDVQHVGLFCHSTGIIFALNTLYCLRDILDPRASYVACAAPWVNDEHPYTLMTKLASKLPNGAFDYWHHISKFALQRVAPVASWSGGILSSMMDSPSSTSTTFANKYGTTEEVGKEIERLRISYLFQEDTTGADEDMRLCLKKEGPGTWGVCEDYAEFVRNLVALEQERSEGPPSSDQTRLTVHAYFASSDIMIGKQGQEYFEQSWRQQGVDRFIRFESRTVDDTNHDNVLFDPKTGVMGEIFKYYAGARTRTEGVSDTV